MGGSTRRQGRPAKKDHGKACYQYQQGGTQIRLLQHQGSGNQQQRGGHAVVHFDHVLTRKAGQRRFVNLHMHLPPGWTLARADALRGEVERALLAAVPGLHASIQMLPDSVEPISTELGAAPAEAQRPSRDEP